MTKKQLTYYFLIILLLIIIDQSSKGFLIYYLKTKPNYLLELLPILDFIYAWNHGISFGLFRNYNQYSNIIFLVLNSIIITYLCYLAIKTKKSLIQLSFTLIIGGALGNLIDRILRGAVFDFIYFHYHNWIFPAFNLADSFITIGACLFIIDYLFLKEDK